MSSQRTPIKSTIITRNAEPGAGSKIGLLGTIYYGAQLPYASGAWTALRLRSLASGFLLGRGIDFIKTFFS
jgi:hypothetical protein